MRERRELLRVFVPPRCNAAVNWALCLFLSRIAVNCGEPGAVSIERNYTPSPSFPRFINDLDSREKTRDSCKGCEKRGLSSCNFRKVDLVGSQKRCVLPIDCLQRLLHVFMFSLRWPLTSLPQTFCHFGRCARHRLILDSCKWHYTSSFIYNNLLIESQLRGAHNTC